VRRWLPRETEATTASQTAEISSSRRFAGQLDWHRARLWNSRGEVMRWRRPGARSSARLLPRLPAVEASECQRDLRTVASSVLRSDKGAQAGDVAAHQERLDRLRSLVRVDGLNIGHLPDDVVLQQDAVAAQQISCLGEDFERPRPRGNGPGSSPHPARLAVALPMEQEGGTAAPQRASVSTPLPPVGP
jgi:hypothetical protein